MKIIKYIKDAKAITGGLTVTSKMPCDTYSLSALDCNVGSKLRRVEDSICSHCYALKGNYKRFHKTIYKAMTKRKKALKNKLWVKAIVKLINAQAIRNGNYFRWHDSGDIQSIEHLKKIIEVAKLTPNILHWLPTREKKIIGKVPDLEIPKNLIIRLSATMIDKHSSWDGNTSSVITNTLFAKKNDFVCLASKQGGQCKKCRACWNKDISNIAYLKH
tara:strand:+ start:3254 stop:3904 length:651 start_codon:yes stop_codon:yes gene_type:complete